MLQSLVYVLEALALLAGQSSGFDVQVVVRSVDAEKRVLVVTAGQQDRRLRVPAGAKVLDAAGRELVEGLKARGLREGARVTIISAQKSNRPVIQAIRLGWRAVPFTAAEGGQQDTSSLLPLTDLGEGEYKGFPGGLYPDGANTRPAAHEAAGIALAGHACSI